MSPRRHAGPYLSSRWNRRSTGRDRPGGVDGEGQAWLRVWKQRIATNFPAIGRCAAGGSARGGRRPRRLHGGLAERVADGHRAVVDGSVGHHIGPAIIARVDAVGGRHLDRRRLGPAGGSATGAGFLVGPVRRGALAPRPTNSTIVEWKGGDLAIGPESGPQRLFSSTDGRSWSELPASTLGFDDPTGNTLLNSATACGDGVLVETVDGDSHVWLRWSTDLSSWTKTPFHNEGYATLAAIGSTAVANVDTGGGAPTGTAMDVSTDCRTWHRVELPGPKVAQITGLAANASGFAAVGESGDVGAPDSRLLAWWSSDGVHWSPPRPLDPR